MRDYILTTVATILVAAVFLFPLAMRQTFVHPIDPCEYQLLIVDDSVIIKDHGRHVATVSLDSTGQMGKELIKDNE